MYLRQLACAFLVPMIMRYVPKSHVLVHIQNIPRKGQRGWLLGRKQLDFQGEWVRIFFTNSKLDHRYRRAQWTSGRVLNTGSKFRLFLCKDPQRCILWIIGGTVLCPLASHFILYFVLVQPIETRTHPNLNETCCLGRKTSTQIR